MRIQPLISIVVVAAALATGCGKKDGAAGASDDKGGGAAPAGDKVASCNVPKEFYCTQYSAATLEAAGEDFLKKTCAGLQGTYATTACATAKQIDKCASPEGDKYDYEGTPAGQTEASCKDGRGGTWTKLK